MNRTSRFACALTVFFFGAMSDAANTELHVAMTIFACLLGAFFIVLIVVDR